VARAAESTRRFYQEPLRRTGAATAPRQVELHGGLRTQYTPTTTVPTIPPSVQTPTTTNQFGSDRVCPSRPIAKAMTGPIRSTVSTSHRRDRAAAIVVRTTDECTSQKRPEMPFKCSKVSARL
jgi:hypothetical protein